MSIRFLYFDIGNVLLSFCNERMCRQMADVAGVPTELVVDALFTAEGVGQVQRLHETGALTPDEFYEHFCTHAKSRPDRARLELAACDIFEPIDAVMSIVERLAAAGNRLGLLSNTNLSHWNYFTDGRYPVLKLPGNGESCFELAVTSHEVGAMKPDEAIYQAAIDRAGVAPGEIFFVDDRPENVAAARQSGIDAVRFTDAEVLIDDLRSRQVAGL